MLYVIFLTFGHLSHLSLIYHLATQTLLFWGFPPFYCSGCSFIYFIIVWAIIIGSLFSCQKSGLVTEASGVLIIILSLWSALLGWTQWISACLADPIGCLSDLSLMKPMKVLRSGSYFLLANYWTGSWLESAGSSVSFALTFRGLQSFRCSVFRKLFGVRPRRLLFVEDLEQL